MTNLDAGCQIVVSFWGLHPSHGSVSVLQVGIGFRFFVRFFKKSVRFSVSVFVNIAISVSVFRFFRLFPKFLVYTLTIDCVTCAPNAVHMCVTTSLTDGRSA